MVYNPLERTTPGKDSIKESKEYVPEEIFDDFNEKTDYWNYRTDNYAEIRVENSVAKLIMGPTEALYYSNAEISDGDFNNLKWMRKNIEFKARLVRDHYGSAGWGFWNYSMVVEESVPIWFIYLRSRSSKYPLNGFFVQVGNVFTPVKYFTEPSTLVKIGLKLFKRLIPLQFTTLNPVIPDLDLSKWHKYTILWKEGIIEFYIDDNLVSKIKEPYSKYRYRIDAWIDNAVFTPLKDDYANVYRHITHENRDKNILEIDYVKLW